MLPNWFGPKATRAMLSPMKHKKLLYGIALIICGCITMQLLMIIGFKLFDIGSSRLMESAIKGEVIEEPDRIADLAQDVVSHKLPPEVIGHMAVYSSLTKSKSIALAPENGKLVISFIQYPKNYPIYSPLYAISAQIRQKQETSSLLNVPAISSLPVIDTREAIINGETTTLTTKEGIYSDSNKIMRVIIGDFTANNGADATFVISGESEYWDDAIISKFIDSMQ
jgi:hypothetical protein